FEDPEIAWVATVLLVVSEDDLAQRRDGIRQLRQVGIQCADLARPASQVAIGSAFAAEPECAALAAVCWTFAVDVVPVLYDYGPHEDEAALAALAGRRERLGVEPLARLRRGEQRCSCRGLPGKVDQLRRTDRYALRLDAVCPPRARRRQRWPKRCD